VTAYREHGHKKAKINPIAITEERSVYMYKYYYINMKLNCSLYSQSAVTLIIMINNALKLASMASKIHVVVEDMLIG
jgi:2-oxoglutarate dehydrogenase complex dehydrogenase (E1) component-like enzyme